MVQKNVVKKGNTDKNSKLFAFLSVFLTVIGFLIAFFVKRDNEYVMFYAKQGLVLFILQVIISTAGSIIFLGSLITPVLWLFFAVLWIMAIIHSLSGEIKETFLVSELAKRISI